MHDSYSARTVSSTGIYVTVVNVFNSTLERMRTALVICTLVVAVNSAFLTETQCKRKQRFWRKRCLPNGECDAGCLMTCSI